MNDNDYTEAEAPAFNETTHAGRLAATAASLRALADTLQLNTPEGYYDMWKWAMTHPIFARDLRFALRASASAIEEGTSTIV
jgi:hypothetical protein